MKTIIYIFSCLLLCLSTNLYAQGSNDIVWATSYTYLSTDIIEVTFTASYSNVQLKINNSSICSFNVEVVENDSFEFKKMPYVLAHNNGDATIYKDSMVVKMVLKKTKITAADLKLKFRYCVLVNAKTQCIGSTKFDIVTQDNTKKRIIGGYNTQGGQRYIVVIN